jgi:hypothetical protein
MTRVSTIACRVGLALVALTAIFIAAALTLATTGTDTGATRSKSACAKHVITDWANDGVVEGKYRPTCLTEAIRRLPDDLRAYSSAEEDIHNALQRSILRRDSSS